MAGDDRQRLLFRRQDDKTLVDAVRVKIILIVQIRGNFRRITDRIDDEDQLRSWDQRHAVQGGLAWRGDNWDVAFAASVHTGWPATDLMVVEDGVDSDGEPEYIAIPGPRNALQLQTFASLDFRISRKWKLNRGSLMAFFEVTNLTNRSNECCLDWDFEEDENTGEEYLDVSYDYWLPLVPAVGILWEF